MQKYVALISLVVTVPAAAHEFWIEPVDYTVAAGQSIQAEVRSGEFFEGEAFPFMPERIVRADVTTKTGDPGGRSVVAGVPGGVPALQYQAGKGIQIFSYQSSPSVLTHENYADFKNFLQEDGLLWVDQAHQQRKLPASGFREKYTRYAKSLVSVDGVTGLDQRVGLPYELVLLSPVYQSNATNDFTLQLLENDKPVNDTQVTVFQKAPGHSRDKMPLKVRTDSQGMVTVPRGNGGEYLVSAVIMKEGTVVPWHSHWTSITFSTD